MPYYDNVIAPLTGGMDPVNLGRRVDHLYLKVPALGAPVVVFANDGLSLDDILYYCYGGCPVEDLDVSGLNLKKLSLLGAPGGDYQLWAT